MVEQNNKFLLRNHQSRLTSFTPFLEVNGISFERNGENKGQGCRRGKNNQYRRRHTHNPLKEHNTLHNKK